MSESRQSWGMVPPLHQGASSAHGDLTVGGGSFGERREYIYLAVDLFTDRAISELPLLDVTMSWAINKPGELSGSIPIGAFKSINAYAAASVPSRTALYVLRDGVPIWGGIIWKRTVSSDSRTIKIEADTWDSYMYHRILYEDFVVYRDPPALPGREYDGVDQIEIFRRMWTHMSAKPYGDIGVSLAGTASAVKRGTFFSKWDFKTYGEILEAFVGKSNGFEWYSTVNTFHDKPGIGRRLEFAYPKFGRTWKESGLVWEYPGTLLKYDWASDADKSVTSAYVVGGGEGDLKAYVNKLNDQAFTAGYPLLDVSYQHTTVWDSEMLASHASKYLVAYSPPIHSVSVDIHPQIPQQLGQYFIGDEVRLVIDDDLFQELEVGEQDMLGRITTLSLSPSDDGLEKITPGVVLVLRDLKIVDPEDETADLVPEGYRGVTVDPPPVEGFAVEAPVPAFGGKVTLAERVALSMRRGARAEANAKKYGDDLWGGSKP